MIKSKPYSPSSRRTLRKTIEILQCKSNISSLLALLPECVLSTILDYADEHSEFSLVDCNSRNGTYYSTPKNLSVGVKNNHVY